MINKKLGVAIVLVLAGGYYFYSGTKKEELKVENFEISQVKRGTLTYEVTATGTINPINTVTVGTQVSGIVETVLADYNDDVKKGQVLALLDSSTLKETMDKSLANYELAQAKERKAKLNYDRIKKLFQDKLTSSASLEDAEIEYKEASANVLGAKADYNIAKKNFEYATITSPVSGTVISKEIEQGQTVAASFETPTLFEVAEDLSKMQIETAVSEADIGMITEGLPVTFTVDAYPTQTFEGTVRQVRLSPTITSNVVVYTVVIDVDNSDLKLKPGMTAFVTILISEKIDVWKVQNSALILRNFDGIVADAGDATPSDHLAILRVVDGNDTVVLVPYERGLVTATETEIISDEIQPSDRIIFGRYGLTSTGSARMGPPM